MEKLRERETHQLSVWCVGPLCARHLVIFQKKMFELVLRSAVLNSSCSDTLSPFLCLGTLKKAIQIKKSMLMWSHVAAETSQLRLLYRICLGLLYLLWLTSLCEGEEKVGTAFRIG